MGNLPDISNLLEAEREILNSQEKLRDSTKKLEDGRKMLRAGIVQLYKTAQVTPEECDHPVVEYRGMGSNYCECCDKYLS